MRGEGAPGDSKEEVRGGKGVQGQEEGRQRPEGPGEPLPRVAVAVAVLITS